MRRKEYTQVPNEDLDADAADGSTARGVRPGSREDRRARFAQRQAKAAERKKMFDNITNKFWAAVWVAAAVATAYYTDYFRVLLSSSKVDRTWFSISLVLYSILGVLIFYMGVYLPRKFFPDVQPQVVAPRAVYTASACMVLGSITLVVACWGVWGFLTPIILGIIGMGFLMSMHFVPYVCCCCM